MSNSSRFTTIVMSKINKILGRIENPAEELDYSYEKQLELLQNVKKGIAELTTAKKTLEIQKTKLVNDIPKLENQAKQCMSQGNEPLTRAALERKNNTLNSIKSLTEQINKLNKDQEKLTEASRVLEMKIEQLKSEKETVKAQYLAAEASVKINESLSGIGDNVGNIGTAMERARDKTDQMNAKSSAIEELTQSGVLTDSLGTGSNNIDKELAKVESKGQIDEEFKKMKKQIMLKNNDLNYFKT